MMTLAANILFFVSAVFAALFLTAATILTRMSKEDYDHLYERFKDSRK
jgi:hypothetical protein